jgi:hypothetical protein
MMNFYVTRAELEKALAQLDIAAKNGFVESQAVFQLARTDKTDRFCRVVREDDSEFTGEVILRSHPTDKRKNWGRVSNAADYKLENGECV